ncbi:MAG: hypothetical protein N2171_00045, partial [Clostridia bacterium]|nr:hypothetical protein [Clostridia bacterium]
MEPYDIAVLGCVYPENMEDEIIKKSRSSTLQFSASAHLRLLLAGMEQALGYGVKLFNILPVGSYPKRYTDPYVHEFEFLLGKKNRCLNIGYFNLTVFKQYAKTKKLKEHIKKWAKQQGKKILIVYSLEPEFLTVAMKAKKLCGCHVCQIVPDLPAYTDIDKSEKILYRLATWCRVAVMRKNIKAADSFVFL